MAMKTVDLVADATEWPTLSRMNAASVANAMPLAKL